jgi:hypothetical protein
MVGKTNDMFADIAIPQRLRRLPRDPRGLVIPWFAWIDAGGGPHFARFDPAKRAFRTSSGWLGWLKRGGGGIGVRNLTTPVTVFPSGRKWQGLCHGLSIRGAKGRGYESRLATAHGAL